MALASGTHLGHYEILAPLGAGGMGEVYRARDTRLAREVAVKVLPASFSSDPERLRRFEQEARAAGQLNHPNLLTVHDFGSHEGCPYVVTELLEGETLRERLRDGALAPRKAIDSAIQIARGLAAAHEKGVVHRDLKPENIFLMTDGRVKILDFGLAKLMPERVGEGLYGAPALSVDREGRKGPPLQSLPTEDVLTTPGMVLGTVGYMSPEQVRAQTVDHRSDVFSFGAILYEMLSGKQPFKRDSTVETMTAILKEEPPELAETNRHVSPGLERVVRRCLEKRVEERFQSASDLAFALEGLSEISGISEVSVAVKAAPSRARTLAIAAGALVLAVGVLAGLFAGKEIWKNPPPSFHRLTFRRGTVFSARFAPDGKTVVYGGAWEGNPLDLFSTTPQYPESRSLGLGKAHLLAISSSGEMAICLSPRSLMHRELVGTLARVPLAGGAPREVLDSVVEADWDPEGKRLAVVHIVQGGWRLEFPIGKILYQTTGWVSHPRISPKGDLVAFLDHPLLGDDLGSVAVVDLAGNKKVLSTDWGSEQGLAWSPNGDEVWFTATASGTARGLYAVTPEGRQRLVERVAGSMTLQDVTRDGRVLVTRDNEGRGIRGWISGERKERDLSWLDWSFLGDLSKDGKLLLFSEQGEGGGPHYTACLRKTDGSPAVRLGEGTPNSLSPDGKWVLSALPTTPQQVMMLPTGVGSPRPVEISGIEKLAWVRWFPDGKRILFAGNEPGKGFRCYLQDMDGGKPQPVTPEGIIGNVISPDGKLILAGNTLEGKFLLYPVNRGQAGEVPGLSEEDAPIQWSSDGRSIYFSRRAELSAKVFRLELSTGRAQLWKEIVPSERAGLLAIYQILITPDGKSYVYGIRLALSDLYLVEGLK